MDYVTELMTRGGRLDDAAALADLFNTIDVAGGGHAGFTADELTGWLSAMVRDPATDSRLVTTADGTVVAAGLVPAPPEGGFRVDMFGGVHPDWRGRGVGRELLTWQLARTGELHGELAPGAHWEAETGAMFDDQVAHRMFERFGFAPVRYFSEMVADTGPTATVALPDGLRCEAYRPEFERALYDAHMEAFADHWGFQRREFDAWVLITTRSRGFRAHLSRVAFDGDAIAGYVLGYADNSPDRVYIGQVGTRRPWRRRGLAGAMLDEVMVAAHADGLKFAGLGVDAANPTGAVGVYERVGFRVESRFVAFRKARLAVAARR